MHRKLPLIYFITLEVSLYSTQILQRIDNLFQNMMINVFFELIWDCNNTWLAMHNSNKCITGLNLAVPDQIVMDYFILLSISKDYYEEIGNSNLKQSSLK